MTIPAHFTCHQHPTGVSSAALAERVRQGDGEATAELFRRIRQRARHAAACWCQQSEVDDAVTEGFVRTITSIDQLRDPAAIERWILRGVARAAIDLSRRAARQRPSGFAIDLDFGFAPSPSAAEVALAACDRQAVWLALAEVPPQHRRLLHLRFHQGLSVREIAEKLGAPEGTLRRRCVEASRLLEQGFLRHQLRPASGSCAPITRLLCRAVSAQLSPKASRRVTAHLRYCRGCRERQDELGELVSGFRRSAAVPRRF